jgi:hypothetical protein
MSHYVYEEYYIDVLLEETTDLLSTDPNDNSNPASADQIITNSTTNLEHLNTNPFTNQTFTTYNQNSQWRPNTNFQRIHNKFQSTILKEHLDTPCVYCGRLLYKNKATWIAHNPSETYPIERVNRIDAFYLYGAMKRQIPKVPTCSSCAKPRTRLHFPTLARIPDEINNVPFHRRKFLSPIYLHSSLGRNPSSDTYSEYRSIVGTMRYSINFRAIALYSGTIGAYLQPTNPKHAPNEAILDDTLRQASHWLSAHNPYLRNYSNVLNQRSNQELTDPFPTATHISEDSTAPPVNPRDIIVPTTDLPNEVHNEDFHYSRLMAGFVRDDNNTTLPISVYDPNLEPLLFPHLFPDGRGTFMK